MIQYLPESKISISHDLNQNNEKIINFGENFSFRILFETDISEALLTPILNSRSSNPNDHFGSDYMSAALLSLSKYLTNTSKPFFEDLFRLFKDVSCPVDSGVVSILKYNYKVKLGNELGDVIARMRPTSRIDLWWIFEQNEIHDMISAAIQLSQHRNIHSSVIEKFSVDVSELEILLYILTKTQYLLDSDQAERIAYMLVSKNWPAFMAADVLDARVPRQLAVAIFRQLLAQGNSSRVSEVVRWLDQSKGAIGALSLENAITNMDNFEAVYKLAEVLAPNLKSNHISILNIRLSELARIDEDYLKLRRFKLRHFLHFSNNTVDKS